MSQPKPTPPWFADRRDAGERLAACLGEFAGDPRVIVLGLPRGGVAVAAEVARILGVPLDIIEVRKIGAPGQPELALGAVASDGIRVWNRRVLDETPVDDAALDAAVAAADAEIRRRDRAYRDGRAYPDLRGRTVILVDDGVATGASMEAAVRAVRLRDPARVIAAVPVASSRACALLAQEADAVVSVASGDRLSAVGQAYRDFAQVGDDAVRSALDARWRAA